MLPDTSFSFLKQYREIGWKLSDTTCLQTTNHLSRGLMERHFHSSCTIVCPCHSKICLLGSGTYRIQLFFFFFRSFELKAQPEWSPVNMAAQPIIDLPWEEETGKELLKISVFPIRICCNLHYHFLNFQIARNFIPVPVIIVQKCKKLLKFKYSTKTPSLSVLILFWYLYSLQVLVLFSSFFCLMTRICILRADPDQGGLS